MMFRLFQNWETRWLFSHLAWCYFYVEHYFSNILSKTTWSIKATLRVEHPKASRMKTFLRVSRTHEQDYRHAKKSLNPFKNHFLWDHRANVLVTWNVAFGLWTKIGCSNDLRLILTYFKSQSLPRVFGMMKTCLSNSSKR